MRKKTFMKSRKKSCILREYMHILCIVDGQDRRSYRRLDIHDRMVLCSKDHREICRLVELSMISVRLECESPQREGDHIRLESEFFETPMPGVVMRSETVGKKNQCVIVFEDLDVKHFNELHARLNR